MISFFSDIIYKGNNCEKTITAKIKCCVFSKIHSRRSRARLRQSSALNIVIKKKMLSRSGAGLPCRYQYVSRDGSLSEVNQTLFFIPWRDCTIIGTRHKLYTGQPSDYHVREEDIKDFINMVNSSYPHAALSVDDVSYFHGGLLPMSGTNGNTEEIILRKKYRIYDHAVEDRLDGLLTVSGVKYTTHRHVAAETVDLVFEGLAC